MFKKLSTRQKVGLLIGLLVFSALVAGSGPIGYVEVVLVAAVLYQLERIRKAIK